MDREVSIRDSHSSLERFDHTPIVVVCEQRDTYRWYCSREYG